MKNGENIMKKFVALLLALVMALSLVACGDKTDDSSNNDNSTNTDTPQVDSSEYALKTQITSTDKITIRIAEDASEIHPSHIALVNCFKEPLEAASNGNITVEIYPNGMLGSLTENVNSMQMGDLEMAYLNDSILSGFIPEFSIIGLPYLFTSVDAVHNAMNGAFGEEMSSRLQDQLGIVNLGWCDVGFRNITNSKKPINTMADLKGLKIRVPAVELQLAAFRSWGVEPHPLAWSETFNGLQQGVVDGQENPHAINRDQKFWEVQKYITNIHYMLWVGPMLVSDPWFRKLDPQTKALVEKAAKEAAAYEWKWSAEQDEIALKECLARGMVINDVSDEPAWTEAARSVWPQFYDKVGGKAVVDEALAIMQQ